MPLLDEIRENNLIKLARTHFDPDLKPAELKVLHDSASSEDLPDPNEKAPRPGVRPEFLRWLATDTEAAPQIDPKGLRVYAATVPGKLDLAKCSIAVPLNFRWCSIKGEVVLLSAKTLGISLTNSSVGGILYADWIDASGPVLFRRNSFAGKITLIGARIKNDLDFSGSKLLAEGDALIAATSEIGGNFRLEKVVECSGTISLQGARIKGDLVCSGAKLEVKKGDALVADSVQIGGNVFLNENFKSLGLVRLVGARIKGNLSCTGANLEVKEGDALMLDGAEIGGSALLRGGFTSSGLVRLEGAQITGDLSCTGAKLEAKEEVALLADGAQIGGNVLLRGCFESSGAVRLVSAQIGGDLDFLGAKVGEVNCKNLRLSKDLLWLGIRSPEKASLNLAGAELKNLREDRESWPEAGDLVLDGLVYEEATLHKRPTEDEIKNATENKNPELTKELELNAEDRIEWLMRQPEDRRTEPHPWMQLSNHLEAKGDHKGAKHVLYELRRLQANKLEWHPLQWVRSKFSGHRRVPALPGSPWNLKHPVWPYLRHPNRCWAIAFAWLEEAPIRILYSITFAVFLGWLVFGYAGTKRAIAPTGAEAYKEYAENRTLPATYPEWNSFIYTLENAAPLAKLGEDEKWAPDPNRASKASFTEYWFLMWFRWLLILFGWFQAAVLAAALLRRFKE